MKIIMYSTGCPKCEVLKQKLNAKGISYSVNTSVDEMLASGISQVPVLEVDGIKMDFKESIVWVNSQ